MTNGEIVFGLDLLIYSLTAAIAIIPLMKDVTREVPIRNSNRTKRKINTVGWVIIGMVLFIGGLMWAKDYYSRKDKKEDERNLVLNITDHIDSSLEKYSLKIDPKTGNVIGRKDTTIVIQEEAIKPPLINIIDGPKFDLGRKKGDDVPIIITVKNFNKGIAKNITTTTITLSPTLSIMSSIKRDNDEASFLAENNTYSFLLNYTLSEAVRSYTIVYFKLSYTDKSGQLQPPLRQYLRVPYPSDKDVFISDLQDSELKDVKAFLKSKGLY